MVKDRRFRRLGERVRVDEVRRYIRTQKEHHTRISFQDELVRLLKKHHIAFASQALARNLLAAPPPRGNAGTCVERRGRTQQS
jgi:hypothetical protein